MEETFTAARHSKEGHIISPWKPETKRQAKSENQLFNNSKKKQSCDAPRISLMCFPSSTRVDYALYWGSAAHTQLAKRKHCALHPKIVLSIPRPSGMQPTLGRSKGGSVPFLFRSSVIYLSRLFPSCDLEPWPSALSPPPLPPAHLCNLRPQTSPLFLYLVRPTRNRLAVALTLIFANLTIPRLPSRCWEPPFGPQLVREGLFDFNFTGDLHHRLFSSDFN